MRPLPLSAVLLLPRRSLYRSGSPWACLSPLVPGSQAQCPLHHPRPCPRRSSQLVPLGSVVCVAFGCSAPGVFSRSELPVFDFSRPCIWLGFSSPLGIAPRCLGWWREAVCAFALLAPCLVTCVPWLRSPLRLSRPRPLRLRLDLSLLMMIAIRRVIAVRMSALIGMITGTNR